MVFDVLAALVNVTLGHGMGTAMNRPKLISKSTANKTKPEGLWGDNWKPDPLNEAARPLYLCSATIKFLIGEVFQSGSESKTREALEGLRQTLAITLNELLPKFERAALAELKSKRKGGKGARPSLRR